MQALSSAQIEEERIHLVLPGFKSHFLPIRFLSRENFANALAREISRLGVQLA